LIESGFQHRLNISRVLTILLREEIVRIVSLLPSATEIVCALGLKDELVGVSHNCDWPPDIQEEKAVVSEAVVSEDLTSAEIDKIVRERRNMGLSVCQLDVELLRELRPDLILTPESCEVCAPPLREVERAVSTLESRPQIVSLEPRCLEEILEGIELIGHLAGREAQADKLITQLKERIDRVGLRAEAVERRPRTLAVEWLEPLYVSGHWVAELIELAGGEPLGEVGEPSYEVSWEDVELFDPEVIVLMSCGFTPERTFRELDIIISYENWQELKAVKDQRVYVTYGSHYFNRPGPRVIVGLEILAKLLHPELFRDVEIPPGSAYPVIM